MRPVPAYSAPAAACAADLLLVLARNGQALTLADLAARTGCTRSLVYRVIGELAARNFVSRTPGGYTLGLATVELGGAYAASVPLITSIRGTLRALADATGESVNLGVLDGDEVLYLMREEGVRSVFAVSHVGKRLPANAVALGKALLARLPNEQVRERMQHLPALTGRTITSLDALIMDLAVVRERGFAEEHGESVSGRCCLAAVASLHEPGFEAVAISVSMDETRFEHARDRVASELLVARDVIERELHHRAAIGEPAVALAISSLA